MKLISNKWIYAILVVIVIGFFVFISWLLKQNGVATEWSNKSLSQATIGDLTGIVFIHAILVGIFGSK